jgi:excisionase family DNA binding protein
MADELLTTGQVADLLNVHAQTVRRWIENGNLRAIRLPSGVWRVRRSDLDALLAA